MRRTPTAGLSILVVLTVLGGLVVPVGAVPVDERSVGDVDVDDISLVIDVQSNGDAHWIVEHRSRLDSPDRRDAFAAFQDAVDDEPSVYLDPFERNMIETAAVAADLTGREMMITGASISAETVYLPQEYGIITYRFTWTGFAEVDGDEIRVGDAIGGLFLDDASTLRINWDEGYRLQSVAPTPDETHDSGVTWRGPIDFDRDEPAIVLSDGSGTIVGVDWPTAGFALAVVLALGLGAAYLVFGRVRPVLRNPSASGSAGDTAVPPDLLSNEEQVLSLLDDRGGRIKQQDIVAELGWSETKTSQVLTNLHEAGKVDRFRLGRENIVSLPDEDNDT